MTVQAPQQSGAAMRATGAARAILVHVGTRARKQPGYAFLYVGHGTAAARKHMSCTVLFVGDVASQAREQIPNGLPAIMAEFVQWDKRMLTFGHDSDSLQWVVRATYNDIVDHDSPFDDDLELPSAAQWAAFNEDIDRWLLNIHATHPVAVFIKPIDTEYGTGTTDWHEWTMDRAMTEVVPLLESTGSPGGDAAAYVNALWQHREDARNAPAHEPWPTLNEAEAVWNAVLVNDTGERLEDQYEHAFDGRNFESSYNLLSYFSELNDAGRVDEAVASTRPRTLYVRSFGSSNHTRQRS